MFNEKLKLFRESLEKELLDNILPFWSNAIDSQNGGFVGRIDHNNNVDYCHEKAVVLNARILWSYSSVYQYYKNSDYLKLAERAFDYLYDKFRDKEHGGVFFMLDCKGEPTDQVKHVFAHAYMIYSLSEYYKVSNNLIALEWAREIFHLLEKHAHDYKRDGYYDQFTRDWKLLENKKSLGSQLHTLEAYSNLYTVWSDQALKKEINKLINLFIKEIIDDKCWKLGVCFDEEWNCLSETASLGHNIEGSWLIYEACKIVKSKSIKEVENYVLNLIDKFYNVALDKDGSIFYELYPDGTYNTDKQWWPQCEAMVGFFLVFKLNNDLRYFESTYNIWNYLKKYFVDQENGGWFSMIDQDYKPASDGNKLGPWKCPYHNVRACLRLISDIDEIIKK